MVREAGYCTVLMEGGRGARPALALHTFSEKNISSVFCRPCHFRIDDGRQSMADSWPRRAKRKRNEQTIQRNKKTLTESQTTTAKALNPPKEVIKPKFKPKGEDG